MHYLCMDIAYIKTLSEVLLNESGFVFHFIVNVPTRSNFMLYTCMDITYIFCSTKTLLWFYDTFYCQYTCKIQFYVVLMYEYNIYVKLFNHKTWILSQENLNFILKNFEKNLNVAWNIFHTLLEILFLNFFQVDEFFSNVVWI